MNNNRIENEKKLREKKTKQLSLLRGEPTVTKLKCVIFKDNLFLLIRKKRQNKINEKKIKEKRNTKKRGIELNYATATVDQGEAFQYYIEK